MDEVLIVISICVILPVTIVWLSMRVRQKETDRKAEIMIKAIEAGAVLDTNFFTAQQDRKTIKERLLSRFSAACVTASLGLALLISGSLLCNVVENGWNLDYSPLPLLIIAGAVLMGISIALFIVYFVGRKLLAREIAAEEITPEQKH